MKRILMACFFCLTAGSVAAHDMFLVVPEHSLATGASVSVSLYNGTFTKSENAVARDRMLDVSVVDGSGEVGHPAAEQWHDEGPVAVLDFETGDPGTYVLGVSTAPNMIELTAEEFDDYLEHDGVLDVLEARQQEGSAGLPVRERYSKHVKTILQVGDAKTGSYAKRLGYPIEIVPLTNPSGLAAGDAFEFLVLLGDQPVNGQLVYLSHEGFHGHDEDGDHREEFSVRTDGDGKVKIEIPRAGRWYVRLIHMAPVEDEDVDYESKWATLTFEVD